MAVSPDRAGGDRARPAPVPGAEPGAVGHRLTEQVGDTRWRRSTLRPIGAGRSNPTYAVDSPAGSVVLRRPPVGEVAATAHDVARERRVIAASARTAVPVPRVLAASTGGPPVDAPRSVTELIEGVVPLRELPPGRAVREDERRGASHALVDVLVTLHAVDRAAVGLSDFGRPEGFLARQVRRWVTRWEQARAGVAGDEVTDGTTGPLPWYVAFGASKLGVVLAGILPRVRAGMVPASMAAGLGGSLAPLVAPGHHVLAEGLDR